MQRPVCVPSLCSRRPLPRSPGLCTGTEDSTGEPTLPSRACIPLAFPSLPVPLGGVQVPEIKQSYCQSCRPWGTGRRAPPRQVAALDSPRPGGEQDSPLPPWELHPASLQQPLQPCAVWAVLRTLQIPPALGFVHWCLREGQGLLDGSKKRTVWSPMPGLQPFPSRTHGHCHMHGRSTS